MYNISSYCCNSCRQNPIFYSFLLKKKFQQKNFHQKKSKNQNWPIFDFSLIGSSVFELEPKTVKLRKQVELCPQGCFYLLVWCVCVYVHMCICMQIYMLTTYQGGALLKRCCSFGCQRGTELVFSCSLFYTLQVKQIFLLPFLFLFLSRPVQALYWTWPGLLWS